MKLSKVEKSILVDDAAHPYAANGYYDGETFPIWCARKVSTERLVEKGLIEIVLPQHDYRLTKLGKQVQAKLLDR